MRGRRGAPRTPSLLSRASAGLESFALRHECAAVDSVPGRDTHITSHITLLRLRLALGGGEGWRAGGPWSSRVVGPGLGSDGGAERLKYHGAWPSLGLAVLGVGLLAEPHAEGGGPFAGGR